MELWQSIFSVRFARCRKKMDKVATDAKKLDSTRILSACAVCCISESLLLCDERGPRPRLGSFWRPPFSVLFPGLFGLGKKMKNKLEAEKHGHKVLHAQMKRLTEEELCSRGWFFDILPAPLSPWFCTYERKPVPRHSIFFRRFYLLEFFGVIFPLTMMINVASCFHVIIIFLGRHHHGKIVSQSSVHQILNNVNFQRKS